MKFVIHAECPAPESQLYRRWIELASTPLERPEWLLSWWEAFAARDKHCALALIGVYDDANLVALAPLYRRRSCLRLLGDGRVCTDHLGLLIGTASYELHRELLEWLLESEPELDWQSMELECIDECSLTRQAASETLGLHKIDSADASCYVDLPSTFEDYLMSLSKNHRKRCRRWQRNYFDRESVQVYSTAGPGESHRDCKWSYDDAFAILKDLHQERRANLGDGAFLDPRFVQFLWSAFEKLAPQGMAEISGIAVDGVVEAAEFELHSAHTVFAYQSGLATTGLSHDAGSLSLMHRIRRAIESGRARYDLMRGTESYKFHWGAKVLPACRIQVWRSNWPGQIARSANDWLEFSRSCARGIASLI